MSVDLIRLTHENLEKEHICCAISGEDCGVLAKKAWLSDRIDEGLVFLKANVRGKCFIEYIPAEYAWFPIDADGYMFIDCLWVSGQFKGHGYSTLLLDECVRDSKEKCKKGLAVLSSKKKAGFLSDPSYLAHKGFLVCDSADPIYELMYLPFDKAAEKPKFRDCVKKTEGSGLSLYYSDGCPFTAKYVPLLEKVALDRGVKMTSVHIDSREKAQNSPSPFTVFSLFFDGKLITHEIQSEKKFEKILNDLGL